MAKTNPKTPEERSEALARAHSRARKTYKTNTKRKRSVTDEELTLIRDMLISLKVVGYTNHQCSMIVGLSKGQVKEICAEESFQKRLTELKSRMPEAAIQLGQAYLVEAVQAVVHVLRTEKKSELVLKAAAELFDRFGLPKVSRTDLNTPLPDPAEGDEIPKTLLDKLRSASPETQAAAADLHEGYLMGVERILAGENGGADEQ